VVCLLSASASTASAGEVTVKAADKLTFSGYTQGQAEYRNDLPDSLVNNTFFIRRARLKVSAEITNQTKSELEIDFASSKLVKDAWLGIQAAKPLALQVGQYKRPFSQEELFSSSATPVLDLGLTNQLSTGTLGYSGRSQGLMAVVKTGGLDASAGIFTGAGEADLGTGDKYQAKQTDNSNSGKDYAARLGLGTGESTRLHTAANVSMRSVGGTYVDGAGVSHQAKDFLAWGFDAELKHGGLSLWGEVLSGDNFSDFTDSIKAYSAGTFLGWHLAGNFLRDIPGNHLLSAWQAEARFELFDPDLDTSKDGSSLTTAGVALFLGKNMRWRTDLEWTGYQSQTPTALRVASELQAKI
jgi:hypothetical protein